MPIVNITFMALTAVVGLALGWAIGGNLWISSLGAAALFLALLGLDWLRDRNS